MWDIGGGGQTFHVCGEINGANAYGATTDYRRFAISVSRNGSSYSGIGGILESPEDPHAATIASIIDQACSTSRFQESWRF